MKLNKLIPSLAAAIEKAGFDKEFTEIENAAIPKIKSGADLYIIAPEGSGKTTAMVIGIIQQLKDAFEEAPRAIVMAATRDKAFELEELFKKFSRGTELRMVTVFDKGKLQYQKDMIYEGVDVVIGTPRRLNELINITGIPMTKVKILAIDDAETLFPNNYHPIVYRIADGMPKVQFIVFANVWTDKFDVLTERVMKNPLIIEADEIDDQEQEEN